MTTPLYSIILPAYNEAEELPSTLRAVRQAMKEQQVCGEIIVVDNNSDDGTAQVASEAGADHVVFEPVNQIARARNAGAAVASGRFLIFVDADTRIPKQLLTDTLEALGTGTICGGGAVIRFEGETTAIGRLGICVWERVSRLTRTAAGSYLFCRQEAFSAVGGFDERLYAGEELQLSRKLKTWGREHGMGFVILRDAPVETSARKMRWYTGPEVLGWVAIMFFLPFAVRSKKLCAFWYRRPQAR